MRRNALSTLLCCLVAAAVAGPVQAQDARQESDFMDMVARGSEEGMKRKKTCSSVDIEDLLARKMRPELEELLVALSAAIDDPVRHLRLGSYYAKRSLWDKAEHRFECALALDRAYAPAWNNLGIVQLGTHNPSAAVRSFKRATKIDGDYALAYFNLGMAYDELDRYGDAVDAYERAITLEPKLATVRHNRQVAKNQHQVELFLRRLRHNQEALVTSLDE